MTSDVTLPQVGLSFIPCEPLLHAGFYDNGSEHHVGGATVLHRGKRAVSTEQQTAM
jgi:hypothetical protein